VAKLSTLADSRIEEASLGIIVTRTNGTVEDHGVVAYYHKNPLRRLWWRLTKGL
jgi:hypothetical protein